MVSDKQWREDKELRKQKRIRRAHTGNLYQMGYDRYKSDTTFLKVFPKSEDPKYADDVYYLKCGWNKADKEWTEEERIGNLPTCPFCGLKMESYSSGFYCTDERNCRHHTHNEI